MQGFGIDRSFRRLAIFTSLCLCAGLSAAASASWTPDVRYSILATVEQGKVGEGIANPENRVFRLPETISRVAFRPELKLKPQAHTRITLRPRLQHEQTWLRQPNKQSDGETQAFMSEAYAAMQHSETLQSVLGLQNFQWGPAELASPSNPLFRDLGLDKIAFFETRGKALLRSNYAPNAQTSLILLIEALPNGEERAAHEAEFQPRAVLKAEYSDISQTNYLGLVLTSARHERLSQGVYAHYELSSGLSLYTDLSLRLGSQVWYPNKVEQGESPTFTQRRLGERKTLTTALLGVRYVTEGASDFRLEWFSDQSAWSDTDRARSLAIINVAPTAQHIALIANPGSLLPGQDFLYVSARIPDWGWRKSLSLTARILHALADKSESAQINLESYWSDHLSLSSGVQSNWGPATGQLTQAYRWNVYGAGTWTW